jgi:hypothetical protein
VQKNTSISTGAHSLNGNENFYSVSAENMVLMVLTLSQKSTNMQSTELYTPVGPLFWSSCLGTVLHVTPGYHIISHFTLSSSLAI